MQTTRLFPKLHDFFVPEFEPRQKNYDEFYFWKENNYTIHKVVVVTREIFAFIAAVVCITLSPTIFIPAFCLGFLMQPQLVRSNFFNTLKKIYYIEPVAMTLAGIFFGMLSYPISPPVAFAYYGFWCGKHVADIIYSEDLFPES